MNDTASKPHEGLPCPVCRVDLVMSDRQGIEIDYCPKCRGVWLDRGELDKIIERSLREPSSVQEQPQPGFLPQPGAPTPWGQHLLSLATRAMRPKAGIKVATKVMAVATEAVMVVVAMAAVSADVGSSVGSSTELTAKIRSACRAQRTA